MTAKYSGTLAYIVADVLACKSARSPPKIGGFLGTDNSKIWRTRRLLVSAITAEEPDERVPDLSSDTLGRERIS
jgi:hypothetical protein